jgi:hypothetical protein
MEAGLWGNFLVEIQTDETRVCYTVFLRLGLPEVGATKGRDEPALTGAPTTHPSLAEDHSEIFTKPFGTSHCLALGHNPPLRRSVLVGHQG